MRHAGEKVAGHRRDDGTLVAVSPLCTHLGCQVNWNTAERSWDCPCHGSRFAPRARCSTARPCTGWRPSRSNLTGTLPASGRPLARADEDCRFALTLFVLVALLPATAQAAPPANDNRATPTPLSLPAAPSGTTTESTLEEDEPEACAELRGSVWYSVQAPARRNVVVRLAAQGDLDAVVDVFQRTRSQLSPSPATSATRAGRPRPSSARRAAGAI